MSYIRYNGQTETYNVTIDRQGEHIVSVTFNGKAITNTNGFLFNSKDNFEDISSVLGDYSAFKTIYDQPKENIVIYSDDKSVFPRKEPVAEKTYTEQFDDANKQITQLQLALCDVYEKLIKK